MLKIKVCGMRDAANIEQVSALMPDYMGFIFYEKSPRYFGIKNEKIDLPTNIKKVGVFVNEDIDTVFEIVNKYRLDIVQLHGQESPQYCIELRQADIEVWKAFSIDSTFDFKITEAYQTAADMYLFDTKTDSHGGSGKIFDWALLEKYNQLIPFMLAGGIDLETFLKTSSLIHNMNIKGIDVNSRFEVSPGVKDIGKLKLLFQHIRK